MLVFVEGGKPENLEKNPRSRDENQKQTQPTCEARSGNRTWATAVGGEHSHHCAIPAPLPLVIQFDVKPHAVQTKRKCLGATVIITAFFNEVMDITKTVKTLNLAKKRFLPNLAKKRILPKK